MFNAKPREMRSDELKQMVARECEFLSYYIEEYERMLSTDPKNQALKDSIKEMKGKWKAYDKVYRFIKETL